LGAPLFVVWEEERGGLNAEDAEVSAQSSLRRGEHPKSTARNGCATRMRKTQERAGQARPLQCEG